MSEAHVVQFYESDSFLVDAIAGHVVETFEHGTRAIIVGTGAHLADLEKVLTERGADLLKARARNQYVDLDATALLSRLLVDSQPNPACFNLIVGGLISGTPPEYEGVWVFDEMVAVLWGRGRYEAALKLEALWNNLARTHDFSLHCAYPQRGFAAGEHEHRLRRICAAHSHLVPGENSLTSSVHRRHTIDQLRQQTIARREKNRLFAFENHAAGRYWLGMDGTILWANEAELNLLGYRRDEYVGRHISDFHAGPAAVEDMLRRLRLSEALRDYPAMRRCKDGSVKSTFMNSAGLWKLEKVAYVCCVTREQECEPLAF